MLARLPKWEKSSPAHCQGFSGSGKSYIQEPPLLLFVLMIRNMRQIRSRDVAAAGLLEEVRAGGALPVWRRRLGLALMTCLFAAVSLHVSFYNLVRQHEALRTTPAVALGITDHVWSIGELIDAALATQPITPTTTAPVRVIEGGKQ